MVSVIIPSYNRAGTIRNAVESVLNQTYADLELLVVDDGSTDNTEQVVNSIRDERVRYIRQPVNKGACVARNRGIQEIKGEYIAFQDSDDVWAADKLEKQMRTLQETGADMVYCGMTRHLGGKSRYFPSDQKPNQSLTLKALLTKNKISTQTILIKKEAAEKVLFDESFRRLQDWDFSTRVLLNGYAVAYLPEALVTATVQTDSITTSVNSMEAYQQFIRKYQEHYDKYPDALSGVYLVMASLLKADSPELAKTYLKKSLNAKFTLGAVVRYALLVLKAWK